MTVKKTRSETAKVARKKRSTNKKGQFVKGNIPTGGRKAGTPNKLTTELKTGIMQAYNDQGGVEYLNNLAVKRPDLFVGLLKAILPTELKSSLLSTGDVTYVVNTGMSNRPPIGVNHPDFKFIGGKKE